MENLIKQLFHSRLLDMRLVIANSVLRASLAISYPTRAHGIIVKYSEGVAVLYPIYRLKLKARIFKLDAQQT